MPHPHSRTRTAPALATIAALALSASLVPGLVAGEAVADDPSCVGKGEYKKIRGGMTIQKLAALLDGQTPFAVVEGKGRQRIRWYAACDGWQSVKDVAVRYRQPVVGRRTVTGKKLAVYVVEQIPTESPTDDPTDDPADGPTDGPTEGPKEGPKGPGPKQLPK